MTRPRILFIDDDPDFLTTVRELMEHLSDGTWEVLVAESGGAGLGILQRQSVDLIVVDLEMPVMDGVQFLQLLQRKYPGIPRTVLTGYATEAKRAACLSAGAEFCLEKPIRPEDLRQLYHTLNELAHPPSDEGFRGVLRRVGLTDVLQMECLAANSSILEVSTPGVHGEIHIRSGRIIHAWAGSLKGVEAFYLLLGMRGGQFAMRPFSPPAEETIQDSWEFLVMEAARRRDEATAETPAAAPAVPQPDDHEESGLEVPSHTSYLPRDTRRPEASRPPPGPGPRIEEVLLCSTQGEVLHDWQCLDPDGRISLMEVVSQKAWHFGQNLALGRLDRVEIQGPADRTVLRIQSDHGLLVRTSLPPPS
jgi:CheY-like chemotaxis protein